MKSIQTHIISGKGRRFAGAPAAQHVFTRCHDRDDAHMTRGAYP